MHWKALMRAHGRVLLQWDVVQTGHLEWYTVTLHYAIRNISKEGISIDGTILVCRNKLLFLSARVRLPSISILFEGSKCTVTLQWTEHPLEKNRHSRRCLDCLEISHNMCNYNWINENSPLMIIASIYLSVRKITSDYTILFVPLIA